MTRYGYARVSTVGQSVHGNSLEDQRERLVSAGADEVYTDVYTGTKLDRPEWEKLMAVMSEGDTLIVTKLDRISRSASQGIQLVDELLAKGICINILNMGVLDDTPTGKLIRNVMFSFAEFERDMIVARTSEGKAIAKMKDGYREGRPTVKVDPKIFAKNKKDVESGKITVRQACIELGIGRTSWYKLCKSL